MRISIITTCYNRAGTISCAVESVLAQDYPDIEYIVVDGASKDGSVETIRRMMDDGRWKMEDVLEIHLGTRPWYV